MTRMPLSFLAIDSGIGGLPSNWWDEINESVEWQDGLFFTLCAAYGLISLVALVSNKNYYCATFHDDMCLMLLILCVCILFILVIFEIAETIDESDLDS